MADPASELKELRHGLYYSTLIMKKQFLPLLILFSASASCIPAHAATPPNILLICVDDLRPELGCYGREHMHTPNIDELASQGRLFSQHYVQVPTCGASRACLLTGRYPRTKADRENRAMVSRYQKLGASLSFPALLKNNGYQTVSIGKVTHYPGGLMGKEWNNPAQEELPNAWDEHLMPSGEWKTPRRAMHGLAGGKERIRGKSPAIEIKKGGDDLYPDGLITETALEYIHSLSQQKNPWLLAVGLIKPHLPFTAPKKYWDLYKNQDLPVLGQPEKPKRRLTWAGSGEFFGGYNHGGKDPRKDAKYAALVRRHYYAAVSYSDAQVGKLLAALKKSGQADNTIVILWGDHGWNLGEKRIWGKHSLYEEALHAPLIIRLPNMKQVGVPCASITETIDIYPTLCELVGLKVPDSLDGVSLKPQLVNASAPTDGLARSFWGASQSIRTETQRLTRQIGKGGTQYNLFLFPEKSQPTEEEVKRVSEKLKGSFFK